MGAAASTIAQPVLGAAATAATTAAAAAAAAVAGWHRRRRHDARTDASLAAWSAEIRERLERAEARERELEALIPDPAAATAATAAAAAPAAATATGGAGAEAEAGAGAGAEAGAGLEADSANQAGLLALKAALRAHLAGRIVLDIDSVGNQLKESMRSYGDFSDVSATFSPAALAALSGVLQRPVGDPLLSYLCSEEILGVLCTWGWCAHGMDWETGTRRACRMLLGSGRAAQWTHLRASEWRRPQFEGFVAHLAADAAAHDDVAMLVGLLAAVPAARAMAPDLLLCVRSPAALAAVVERGDCRLADVSLHSLPCDGEYRQSRDALMWASLVAARDAVPLLLAAGVDPDTPGNPMNGLHDASPALPIETWLLRLSCAARHALPYALHPDSRRSIACAVVRALAGASRSVGQRAVLLAACVLLRHCDAVAGAGAAEALAAGRSRDVETLRAALPDTADACVHVLCAAAWCRRRHALAVRVGQGSALP